jgi:cytochrome c-type biogenesis protein CcmH
MSHPFNLRFTYHVLRFAPYTLLLIAFLLFLPNPALAQTPTPRPVTDDEVNAVAKQLYCPVCENIPLDVCSTQACQDWREEIRLKLSQGWNTEQIKQYFADRFGDRVLAAPPARGLNWLVYLFPPAAIVAGVFILYRAFKAWKQPASSSVAASPTTGPVADEYIKRLEEEMQKRQ